MPIANQGVQAWDRFAYVNNNPVRYTDPGGHRTCTAEEAAQDTETCDQNFQVEEVQKGFNEYYGWEFVGIFTVKELVGISKTALTIKRWFAENSKIDGYTWLNENAGNVKFINYELTKNNSIVVGTNLFLAKNFEAAPPIHLIHEFMHIYDNNSLSQGSPAATFLGGGLSSKMIFDLGSNPFSGFCGPFLIVCLMGNGHYQQYIAGNNPWPKDTYANHGVADDFAETMTWSIYNPNVVPIPRRNWAFRLLEVNQHD